MLLRFIHGAVYFLVLCKWLEYGALWSTAVVISVLEEKRGFEAFSSAAKLIKGGRMVGFILMLVYTVWRLSLGLPTFFEKWSFHRGVVYAVLDSSFLCVGQVMNWVVFVDKVQKQRTIKLMVFTLNNLISSNIKLVSLLIMHTNCLALTMLKLSFLFWVKFKRGAKNWGDRTHYSTPKK